MKQIIINKMADGKRTILFTGKAMYMYPLNELASFQCISVNHYIFFNFTADMFVQTFSLTL